MIGNSTYFSQTVLKKAASIGALGLLCACQPAVPSSNYRSPSQGAGFEPIGQSQAQPFEPRTVAPESAALPAGQTSMVNGRQVINASPTNPAPLEQNNPGLSDENDFEAVSNRQTIESDKARLESLSAQYSVVEPTNLPSRLEEEQPNIVAYALKNTHPVGTNKYRRSRLANKSKHQRNCASYRTDDDAQLDFLKLGGPSKDRLVLDPDGDGYACGWNPSKYRG